MITNHGMHSIHDILGNHGNHSIHVFHGIHSFYDVYGFQGSHINNGIHRFHGIHHFHCDILRLLFRICLHKKSTLKCSKILVCYFLTKYYTKIL